MNLFCKAHKSSNEASRSGYDAIRWNDAKETNPTMPDLQDEDNGKDLSQVRQAEKEGSKRVRR